MNPSGPHMYQECVVPTCSQATGSALRPVLSTAMLMIRVPTNAHRQTETLRPKPPKPPKNPPSLSVDCPAYDWSLTCNSFPASARAHATRPFRRSLRRYF
eukprot:988246-Amphidinium_carterae.2